MESCLITRIACLDSVSLLLPLRENIDSFAEAHYIHELLFGYWALSCVWKSGSYNLGFDDYAKYVKLQSLSLRVHEARILVAHC